MKYEWEGEGGGVGGGRETKFSNIPKFAGGTKQVSGGQLSGVRRPAAPLPRLLCWRSKELKRRIATVQSRRPSSCCGHLRALPRPTPPPLPRAC